MNTSFTEQGVQFAWDATSLKLAEECPRKYYYIMRENWTAPTKSAHLRFGGHYATALEHYHKHRAAGMDYDEAVREVVREALVNTWDAEGPWESEDPNKTRENLIRTIVWYLEQFKEDAVETIILANGKPAVELSFSFPVDDDYIFAGHLDRLGTLADAPYVQDQKTTKTTITSYYYRQFDMDMQMSMYTFVGRAAFDIPVSGVMIDAAQIAIGFSRFERGFTFRSPDQLTEWYDNTMELIHTYSKYALDNHYPMNTSSCNNYGGCPFRQVCSCSPRVRGQFLKSNYSQREPWDPLKRR